MTTGRLFPNPGPRYRFPAVVLAGAAAFLACAGTVAAQDIGQGIGDENLSISFTTEDGSVFDGWIEMPPKPQRKPWAVMLLGGGLGTSIDWLVPGVLTIDGEPTRDAATIARALLDEGLVVMRWESIRRGDPLHSKDPLMFDPLSYEQSVEQTRKAFALFRDKKVVPDDHIFLLAHGLGARRAAVLVEDGAKIPGLVIMAGASLIPSHISAVRAAVTYRSLTFLSVDLNSDGFISRDEWQQYQTDAPFSRRTRGKFPKLDLDGDDAIDRHEWAIEAVRRSKEAWEKPTKGGKDQYGHRWSSDVFAKHPVPTLAVVGTLDERHLYEAYLLTWRLTSAKHPDYQWRFFDDAGHNLGWEVAGAVIHEKHGEIAKAKVGPISPDVVEYMVNWIVERAK